MRGTDLSAYMSLVMILRYNSLCNRMGSRSAYSHGLADIEELERLFERCPSKEPPRESRVDRSLSFVTTPPISRTFID